MTEGDKTSDSIEDLVREARERVASAPIEAEIRSLADHAILQINTLADEAMVKARQVDVLMRRLAELLEQG